MPASRPSNHLWPRFAIAARGVGRYAKSGTSTFRAATSRCTRPSRSRCSAIARSTSPVWPHTSASALVHRLLIPERGGALMRRTPNRPLRFAVFALVLAVAASLAACGKDDKVVNPAPTGAITWNNSIRHLIADRSEGTAPTGCTSCHHTGTTITYFDGGSGHDQGSRLDPVRERVRRPTTRPVVRRSRRSDAAVPEAQRAGGDHRLDRRGRARELTGPGVLDGPPPPHP